MRNPIALLMMFFVAGACFAQAPAETAKLKVNVINGTVGGTSVEGAEVMVEIYNLNTKLDSKSVNADKDGNGGIDVPTGSGLAAVVHAKHSGMLFGGNVIELRPGSGSLESTVMVFDVSGDNSVIEIDSHHIVVRVLPEHILVEEYMRIVNPTDKAITSDTRDGNDHPVVLEMLLPEGFSELKCLEYFQENALEISKKGFYDIMAVPPGRYDAGISYKLEKDSSKLKFLRTVSNSTRNVVVVVQLADARLEDLGTPTSKVSLDTKDDADYYELTDKFEPGQAISFTISGLDSGSQQRDILILSVIFSIIGFAVLLRLRPKNRNKVKSKK